MIDRSEIIARETDLDLTISILDRLTPGRDNDGRRRETRPIICEGAQVDDKLSVSPFCKPVNYIMIIAAPINILI